jgi:hypothetical protein
MKVGMIDGIDNGETEMFRNNCFETLSYYIKLVNSHFESVVTKVMMFLLNASDLTFRQNFIDPQFRIRLHFLRLSIVSGPWRITRVNNHVVLILLTLPLLQPHILREEVKHHAEYRLQSLQ